MPSQLWVIEGESFPPAPIPPREAMRLDHPGDTQHPLSVAYFCPKCGDVWARRIILDSPPDWILYNRHCGKHPPQSRYFPLPGSIWLDFRCDVIENLPSEVLRREALIYIRADNF